MTKSRKYSRIPSSDDIACFTGMHCHRKYRDALASEWRCPSCGRSAQELIRLTKIRGPYWRAKFGDAYGMGFTASIVDHHCHGDGRFPPTRLCGDCNSADGATKRKWQLPSQWSFSPAELALFVRVAPHSGETHIDHELALQIFRRNYGANWAGPTG